MKKTLLLFFSLLLSTILISCSNSKYTGKRLENTNNNSLKLLKQGYITKEDALDEFIFLYDTIKESFPHLNAFKRKYEKFGLEPNKSYTHYYTLLSKDYNEIISVQDYYNLVKKYINEYFGFAHMSIYDPRNFNYVYSLQKTLSLSGYNDVVAINGAIESLNNERSLIIYNHLGTNSVTTINNNSQGSDLIFKFFDDYSAAYVNIYSFAGERIETDKESLLEFYKNISAYENLIIDISKNGGGTIEYWRDLLILPNIDEPLIGTFTPMFFMDSPDIKAFVDELGITYYSISDFDVTQYSNFNNEDLKSLDYVIDTSNCVNNYFSGVEIPNEKIFEGKIYIITGNRTYSAADQFAYFAKSTGFATLVGTNTRGGTGVLGYPFHLILPKSGLAIRYDSLYRIDETGKSIDEFGTPPDILVETNYDALQACLDYIESTRE